MTTKAFCWHLKKDIRRAKEPWYQFLSGYCIYKYKCIWKWSRFPQKSQFNSSVYKNGVDNTYINKHLLLTIYHVIYIPQATNMEFNQNSAKFKEILSHRLSTTSCYTTSTHGTYYNASLDRNNMRLYGLFSFQNWMFSRES